jgi:predicted dehydrogenase
MADFATVLPTRLKPAGSVGTFDSKLTTSDATEEVPVTTEDYATVMLRFDNGARGVVTLSQVSAGHKNQMMWEINGSAASLRWQGETPNTLWIGHRDAPNQLVTKDPALMADTTRHVAGYPGGHAEGYPDTFRQSFLHIYDAITHADPTMPRAFATFADGAQELALCEAILQSASSGQWVHTVTS